MGDDDSGETDVAATISSSLLMDDGFDVLVVVVVEGAGSGLDDGGFVVVLPKPFLAAAHSNVVGEFRLVGDDRSG